MSRSRAGVRRSELDLWVCGMSSSCWPPPLRGVDRPSRPTATTHPPMSQRVKRGMELCGPDWFRQRNPRVGRRRSRVHYPFLGIRPVIPPDVWAWPCGRMQNRPFGVGSPTLLVNAGLACVTRIFVSVIAAPSKQAAPPPESGGGAAAPELRPT